MAIRPVRHPAVDDDALLARPFLNAGAPVSYTDGDPAATYEGIAPKGALLIDTTNGKLYINTGTKAQQTWTVVGSQS